MNTKYGFDIRDVKAGLLCLGARILDHEKAIRQYPSLFDENEIHGAHLQLEWSTSVNVCFADKFVMYSPYTVLLVEDSWTVFYNNQPCSEGGINEEPPWYQKELSGGGLMKNIFREHGLDVLADAKFTGCRYLKEGRPCLFCSFKGELINQETKLLAIPSVLEDALRYNPRYSVALSDGVKDDDAATINYFCKALKAIKGVSSEIAVSVEFAPPSDLKVIDAIMEAGATSIILNLEFGDLAIRKLMCPGKSEISFDKYPRVWNHAISGLGKGKVSSVLLAGVERRDITIQTAADMIDIGVLPTIIPFRPYDSCYLNNFRTMDPKELVLIERDVTQRISAAQLDPKKQKGCISCGACSLESDFLQSQENAASDITKMK